jgi:hypothetical protein
MRTELIQRAYDIGNKIGAAIESGSDYQMSEVDELMELTEQLEGNEIDALLGVNLGNHFLVKIDNRDFYQN